jgi:hypothetical protein
MKKWILRKLLTFFGRMENKIWRKLYVCNKRRTNSNFSKSISSQSPNPSMFEDI